MSQQGFVLTVPAPTPAEPVRRRMTMTTKALWLIGVGLVLNAGVMLYSRGAGIGPIPEFALERGAYGDVGTPVAGESMLGARGIYMMPGQVGPQAWGMYLMDVDSGTICVYRVAPETGHFRLMAARSYKYDRFLEDFNNDGILPKQVQKSVEDQRQRQELHQKDDQPTVDQHPKPDENLPDGANPAMVAPVPPAAPVAPAKDQ